MDQAGECRIAFQFHLTDRRSWNFDQSTIARAVNVYVSKVHCQPLPLFETIDLGHDTAKWPQCLLLSLVLITSRLSPDVMPEWTLKERRDCYRKARREVMIKLAEDFSHLEVLQSLCLLILEEIAGERIHTLPNESGD